MARTKSSLLAAAVFALAALSAAPAAAQREGWTPRKQGNRLGADIDLWPTAEAISLSTGFVGQMKLSRRLYLDFDLPWAVVSRDSGPDRVALGNPTVGLHFATWLGRRAAFYIGGSLSAPLSAGDRDVAVRAAHARALYDLHRFAPDHVYARVPLGFEIGARPFFARFEVVPVVWLATTSRRPRAAQFGLEHATELELRSNRGFGGGLRLQAVALPGADDGLLLTRGDLAQLALEPFLAYEPEPRGFFARVGLLVAVDPPLGPGFERNRLTTGRVTLGGKW